MQRLRFRQFPLISVGLFSLLPAAFFIAIFLYVLYGPSPFVSQVRQQIQQLVAIMQTTQKIDEAVQDVETGQRGFLLTNDETYLAPYSRALPLIPQLIGDLRLLTGDDPQQQAKVASLQTHVTSKLAELSRTVDTMKRSGYDAARAIVLTNAGRDDMEGIRSDLAAITNVVQGKLNDSFTQGAVNQHRSLIIVLIESGVCLASLLGGAVLIVLSYRRRLRAEQVLQATLDSLREGVSAFDDKHRLVAWNQLFVKMLRLPADFVRHGLRLEAFEAFEKSRAEYAIAPDLSDLDMRARRGQQPLLLDREHPDGTVLALYHNPTSDGAFVTTYLDVTERRNAERVARQAQKMEALGQMTGGIAHDFNNLLTIIVGNLDRLRNRLAGDASALKYVDLALIGADRGAKMTHQLLAFARKQPLQPRPVLLTQLMPDLTDMLRRSLGELVEIETIGTGGLWNTAIDPNQFESAVLNLAINARDAMPSGGKLTLEVANVWLDEAYAGKHDEVAAGQYVMFGVTDTGSGMPPEIAARAFDPFFTTKGDKGTGLGLSMVYGFVKQSGGHMKIYSEPGHGTTVKLYLPRTVESEVEPYRVREGADLSGTETILVVEDDDIVRMTVVGLLEGLGYRALQAANGAFALTILESPEPISLLFTDVVMPGSVSSRVLAERATELRPDIKVLFTSGYTENTIVHNGRLDPGVQLISKPYSREQLALKIRAQLDRPDASPAEKRLSETEPSGAN